MKNLICLIGQLGNGGTERQLSLFLKYLDREKYNPMVVVTNNSEGRWKEYIENELSVKINSLGDSNAALKLLKYRSILSKYKPAAVLCWSFFANPLCKLSWGTKFIGALRNDLAASKAGINNFHIKQALKPKHFIVNSSLLNQQLNDAGIDSKKISTVYNIFEKTTDFENEEILQKIRSTERKKYNIPDDAIVVAWAARDNPGKGFPFFVDVFEKAAQKIPNLHAFLGGTGSLAIESEIVNRALKDKVTIAGDIKNIRLILPLADIFFLPSISEGMPNIFIEAIDAKCGLLATDTGGIKDILSFAGKDIVSKLLIEKRESDLGAEKLTFLCENSKFRKEATEEVRKILDEMRPETIMRQFYKIIEN
jgi:glycosyltransferase involved in cell wall biosynthesis